MPEPFVDRPSWRCFLDGWTATITDEGDQRAHAVIGGLASGAAGPLAILVYRALHDEIDPAFRDHDELEAWSYRYAVRPSVARRGGGTGVPRG